MKIYVRVKTNMREERVEREDEAYAVSVKEPAKENKANRAVIELLSEYFKVPKSQVFILSGLRSKHKIIEIKGLDIRR